MSSVQLPEEDVTVYARNVGGISETEVELHPGVNVLAGRNATNRTSFLRAIMAALGSDRVSLKGDADEGEVTLTVGEETYRRVLRREDGEVALGGTPYLEDAETAELFAFLLESNEARRAVARGDDLREIIMRPVDTDAIRAEIEELSSRLREIDAELEDRDRLEDALAELVEERDRLDGEIEEKRAALEAKREEVAAADADLDETREAEAELEARLSELQEARSTAEDLDYRLETERETLAELRAELSETEEELAELADAPETDREELDRRLDELRERKRALDSRINQLQGLVQFNQELLEGDTRLEFLDEEPTEDVTEQLLPGGEALTCWTCGADTSREEIERTLDRLRDRRSELVDERASVTDDLEAVTERKAALDERERRRQRLDRSRARLEAEIEETEAEIEELTERRADVDDRIDRLEADVEALRGEEHEEIVELHTELNEIEADLDRLVEDRDRIDEERASIEERLEELDALEEERSEVASELEDARTRIERLEAEAIEAFNGHMETVLDALEYDRIERIWIERTEREVREGRRTVTRGFFDLHVVRGTDAGTVYEDTVDHLSESEREVTGLVFALAGYLAHEVHERMPFVVLDSLEAIDSGRIATLIDYLGEYAGYLVVALLPEDAAALEGDHAEITSI